MTQSPKLNVIIHYQKILTISLMVLNNTSALSIILLKLCF